MLIRTIEPQDYTAVADLIQAAFTSSEHGYTGEAELVTALRADPTYQAELELVAIQDQQLVGHGLLSKIQIGSQIGLALAPLSVRPANQQQGIGSQLIAALEQRARQLGYPLISILGDPDYYGRFGYQPAINYQITAPFEVPTNVYLVKALLPDGLAKAQGTVQYRPAFGL